MFLLTGIAGVASAAEGRLRLAPTNSKVFEFRGKPTLLVTSAEHYGSVLNLDFDYTTYLDELKAHGLNYTRIFSGAYVELPGAFGIERNTLAPAPGRFLAPWSRSDRAGYANGGNKFDLSKWDPAYFERLGDFVQKASDRGIVVEMTLFSALYGEKGWTASPLYVNNNVNGVGKLTNYKKVHSLDNGDLLAHQERLVAKLVSALSKFDNVLFELQNEPWADMAEHSGNATRANEASLAWQRRMAIAIGRSAGDGPAPLIAQNVTNRTAVVLSPDPAVSVFHFHYATPPLAVAENAHIARVIGFDESGFNGSADATYRAEAWQFILAGGGLFNNLDYSFAVKHEQGTAVQKAPGGGSRALREQLGFLLRTMNGFGDDLLAMQPGEGFVKGGAPSGARARFAPGRAYVLYVGPDATTQAPYLPANNTQKPAPISLELPFGSYAAEWFDAAAGRSLMRTELQHGGGLVAIAVPAGPGDRVLRIVRQTSAVVLEKLGKGYPVMAIASPNKSVYTAVILADLAGTPGYTAGRKLYYRVEQGLGAERLVVLPWSPLGLMRADADFVNDLEFVSQSHKTVRDRYSLKSGKKLEHDVSATEGTFVVRGRSGEKLAVDLRAYDEGAAVRYRFGESKPGLFQVTGETTGFQLPVNATGFMTEHDEADQYHPAYENQWRLGLAAGTPSTKKAGWSFPALFRLGEGRDARWALLSEAGLDRSYLGSRLSSDAPGGLYQIRFPDALEGEAIAPVLPSATLPWTMPWRLVITGKGLSSIVESNLVTHLAAPSRIRDTKWIVPGRSSWSWWSETSSPRKYDRLVAFVDLAAEMGWEYSLVDANWDTMEGGDWKKLTDYARTKKVRLLLWYNSGGPNNVVAERPRDRMFEREKRREEFKRISQAGIAGIKVDFFQSDKQAQIHQYLGILEDAAEFKILVNFHGCTLPRGWARTYPNLMSHEAVRGGETYLFGKDFSATAPAHNTVLAFTRNVVGGMDYTPVTFSDNKFPHITTNAHELALSVVFEAGVLHLADGVASYRSLPDAPKTFLKAVPTSWDETRYLDGEPGKLAVLARRKGKVWIVAGINGEASAKTVSVALSFLAKGSYQATVIADGDSDRSFKDSRLKVIARDAIPVALRGNGGFVIRMEP